MKFKTNAATKLKRISKEFQYLGFVKSLYWILFTQWWIGFGQLEFHDKSIFNLEANQACFPSVKLLLLSWLA